MRVGNRRRGWRAHLSHVKGLTLGPFCLGARAFASTPPAKAGCLVCCRNAPGGGAQTAPTNRSGPRQVRRRPGCPPAPSHGLWLLCPPLSAANPSPTVAARAVPLCETDWLISRDKPTVFRPTPVGSPPVRLGDLGFHCLRPTHAPPDGFYPIAPRQVVAVVGALPRPRPAATPTSLAGRGSLCRARSGLARPSGCAIPGATKATDQPSGRLVRRWRQSALRLTSRSR